MGFRADPAPDNDPTGPGRRDGRRRRPRRTPASVAKAREERAEITDPTLVLEAALRFLEARQRSSDEVRRRLLLHGYRHELVDGAIARLTELGILDDEAFARAWVESRDRAHPRGERALRVELRQKGIDRMTTDGVIEEREIERPEANAQAAARLLARHARALDRIADGRDRRNRAYALLARNGFDSETAVGAINAFLAATGDHVPGVD